MKRHYDLLVIGGGIGGAALAKAMAERGADVLVLEATSQFCDRVRGEWLASWGVAEARLLGLLDAIMMAGGHELRYLCVNDLEPRDLKTTTPSGESSVAFFHPAVQEALLTAASEAGATVQRGVEASIQVNGDKVDVHTRRGDRSISLSARLVVAADGRNSLARRQAGFVVCRNPDFIRVSGVLCEGVTLDEEVSYVWVDRWADPSTAIVAISFPQGNGRVRAYVAYRFDSPYKLSGSRAFRQMLDLAVQAGAPPNAFASARIAGPLAVYKGADVWVDYPYHHGVALLGDAAGASDPVHGQGLSLTLRDARVLRDSLLATGDWEIAAHIYATQRQRYFQNLLTFEAWERELNFAVGQAAVIRRERVYPLHAQYPARAIDFVQSGPDAVPDEAWRCQYFCEDLLQPYGV